MKIYKMIIEKEYGNDKTREVYESKTQGKVPHGYRLVGVCGYYEKKSFNDGENNNEERN